METHQTKPEKTPARDIFLRTVAVLGLIAILLLGAWGIIQLAFAIPTVFGNLGGSVSSLFSHTTDTTSSTTKEVITVTVPTSIVSGQVLELSWMHQNADSSGQYSYAVSYACESGLTLKAPLPNGSYQNVPCNTLFNYVNATQHMSLMPSITGTVNTPLAVTVTATKLSTGATSATGVATTNVTSTTATAPIKTQPAATHTTKPATTYYPATTRSTNLYGYGDLAVHITSIAPQAGVVVVKFVIENDGTNVINSGWTFNANLPMSGGYLFGSQPQQALYPGDKIAYSLAFTPDSSQSAYGNQYNYGYGYPTSGYTTNGYMCNGYTCNNNSVGVTYPYGTYGYAAPAAITITADPSGFVQELNKNNNTAQTSVQLY